MISQTVHSQSLYLIRKIFIIGVLLVFTAQIFVDSSSDNIFCNILAVAAFIPLCLVVFSVKNSSLGAAVTATAIFLNVIANSLAPMVGTLLEGNSLRFTLLMPIDTFFHRWLFTMTLLAAQILVTSRNVKKSNLVNRLSKIAGTNLLIPEKGVWVLGCLGFLGLVFKFLPVPVFISKFLDGFSFLMYAPFLLLLPPYFKNNTNIKGKVFMYYLIILVASVAGNSRMGMVGPIAMLASSYVVCLLIGTLVLDRKKLRFMLLGVVILYFSVGIFSDISTAIVVERAQRSNRSLGDQFTATYNRFFDKESLDKFRLDKILLTKGVRANDVWQENYVRNPFIARFVQIKFDDNCFYRVSRYNYVQVEKLQNITIDKTLALLPQPVLEFFKIKIDKEDLNSYSTGDLIDVLSGRGFLGGFKTGSIPAHAYGMMGFVYPIVLLILYYLIFYIYQNLFVNLNSRNNVIKSNEVATLGLLIAFDLFLSMSLDGVNHLTAMLLRIIWETMLIYGVAIYILRILKIINKQYGR